MKVIHKSDHAVVQLGSLPEEYPSSILQLQKPGLAKAQTLALTKFKSWPRQVQSPF